MGVDIEMRWVAAWDLLYDLTRGLRVFDIVLPDGQSVSLDDCQGYLQRQVYAGYQVALRRYTRKDGRQRIAVRCWRPDEPAPSFPEKTVDGFVRQDDPTKT